MAKKWSEVVASEAFQALSAPEKYKAREEYFNSVIAPQVPEKERGKAKTEFYRSTHDQLFSTGDEIGFAIGDTGRILANALTFNLADKAVAAGRAALDSELDYDEALAQERDETRLARDRAGWAGTAADVVGGGALGVGLANRGMSLIGSKAVQNMGTLGKTVAGAAEGAGYGAAYAVGGADKGLDLTDNLSAAAVGAGTGAIAGGLAAPAAHGAARLLQALGVGGAARARLPAGPTLSRGAQSLADKAFLGERGTRTLERLNRLGPDAMALNANPDMKGAALGIVSKGGAPGEMVEEALERQFAGRSDRLFRGVDDSLGTMRRDPKLILESFEEAMSDTRPEYTRVLTGVRVRPDLRKKIIGVAKDVGKDWASGSPVREALNKFTLARNLPANAVQLRNLKNDLDRIAKKYPAASSSVFKIKRAIDDALKSATGGDNGPYAALQRQFAEAATGKEVVDRAYRFLDTPENGLNAVRAREITADMTANPRQAELMREVARGRVDDLMRTRSNEISAIQSTIGRTANAANREKIGAIFGERARDRLANTVEAEVSKSRDYAEILRNSNTARKQAAMQEIDRNDWTDLIPDNRSTLGVTSELIAKAIQRMKAVFGDVSSERSRALIARMATMTKPEIEAFIAELERSAATRAARGRAAAGATAGAVAATGF